MFFQLRAFAFLPSLANLVITRNPPPIRQVHQ